jgi:hypothetical protein
MMGQTIAGKSSPLRELVACRAPLRQFMPFFKNRREAVEHFASAHAAMNTLRRVKGSCIVCKGEPAHGVVVYRWCATFFDGIGFSPLQGLLLAVGHVGVTLKTDVVTFDTHHPICRPCWKRVRRRRWLANVLNFIGLFLAIVAGGVSAILWSCFIYFNRPAEREEILIPTVIANAAFAFGIACMWSLKTLRVPPALRYLASRPIFYQSAKWVAEAQNPAALN